jgi:hypothetical protein
MSLGFKIDRQCPKCYTDRTLLDTSFALPGHIGPQSTKNSDECVNVTSACRSAWFSVRAVIIWSCITTFE